MTGNVHILIADDDMGHATLIRRNLKRMRLANPVTHFKDGQEVLDFLFKKNNDHGGPSSRLHGSADSYLLLLDIRMPKVDGIEVLRRIKTRQELEKIPVIMITTTDDPGDIDRCHAFGCDSYIVKPVDYDKFFDVIQGLGLSLKVRDSGDLSEPTQEYFLFDSSDRTQGI